MTALEALTVARDALKAFSPLTPSTIDDNIVKVLDWVLANPTIIGWIKTLGLGDAGDGGPEAYGVPAALAEFADREKIDWQKLLPILLAIGKLIAGL